MRRFLNQRFAARLMVAGGIIIAVSVIMNLVRLLGVYSMVGDRLDKSTGCSMDAVLFAGTIAMVIGMMGAVTLVGGFVVALISRSKHK